jgi:hypothetical protein
MTAQRKAQFEICTEASWEWGVLRQGRAVDLLMASAVRLTIISTPSRPSSALARVGSPDTPLAPAGQESGRRRPGRTMRGSTASSWPNGGCRA